MMSRMIAAASPQAFVASLGGWQRPLVESMRATVLAVHSLEECIKWGNLVYLANGPVMLIRAEPARVLLGFWRGKRLHDLEPRLRASGKYELANWVLREGDEVRPDHLARLLKAAVALNSELGDPTAIRPQAGSTRAT